MFNLSVVGLKCAGINQTHSLLMMKRVRILLNFFFDNYGNAVLTAVISRRRNNKAKNEH